MKKSQLEAFSGKDKLIGRPMKLNRINLEANDKGYAPLLFFGDLHWGSEQCATKQALAMLDWALREHVPTLLMGDLMEIALRDSVGHGVYQQKLNPQEQVEAMIELLTPLAEANLLVGIHEGNHEQRITKGTGIDITKFIAKLLKIPYCSYACWHLINVGKQKYTLYSTHGSSNSTQSYTKLNAAIKIGYFLNSDIIAYGHTHELSTATRIIQQVDLRSRCIIERKQYIVMTGSYLNWEGGYAQQKGLPIAKLGSPKAKFMANSHDVHFSL
jgi:hypothetical protein